jgi:hypothetical protein
MLDSMTPYALRNKLDEFRDNFAMKRVSGAFKKEIAKLPLSEEVRSEVTKNISEYCAPYKKKFETQLDRQLHEHYETEKSGDSYVEKIKQEIAPLKNYYDEKEIKNIEEAERKDGENRSRWLTASWAGIFFDNYRLEKENEMNEKKEITSKIIDLLGFENALQISVGLEKKANVYLILGLTRSWMKISEFAKMLFPKEEL